MVADQDRRRFKRGPIHGRTSTSTARERETLRNRWPNTIRGSGEARLAARSAITPAQKLQLSTLTRRPPATAQGASGSASASSAPSTASWARKAKPSAADCTALAPKISTGI